jgi:hypothetical protein
MADEQSRRRLSKSAREHIDSEDFEQAEIALRKLLEEIDPGDHMSRISARFFAVTAALREGQ